MDDAYEVVSEAALLRSWGALTTTSSPDEWRRHFVGKKFDPAGDNELYIVMNRSPLVARFGCQVPKNDADILQQTVEHVCRQLEISAVSIENMGLAWSMNILPLAAEQRQGLAPSQLAVDRATEYLRDDPFFSTAMKRMGRAFMRNYKHRLLFSVAVYALMSIGIVQAVNPLVGTDNSLVPWFIGAAGFVMIRLALQLERARNCGAVAKAQHASQRSIMRAWLATTGEITRDRIGVYDIAISLADDLKEGTIQSGWLKLVAGKGTGIPDIAGVEKDGLQKFMDRCFSCRDPTRRGLIVQLRSAKADLAGTRLVLAALPKPATRKAVTVQRPGSGGGAGWGWRKKQQWQPIPIPVRA